MEHEQYTDINKANNRINELVWRLGVAEQELVDANEERERIVNSLELEIDRLDMDVSDLRYQLNTAQIGLENYEFIRTKFEELTDDYDARRLAEQNRHKEEMTVAQDKINELSAKIDQTAVDHVKDLRCLISARDKEIRRLQGDYEQIINRYVVHEKESIAEAIKKRVNPVRFY